MRLGDFILANRIQIISEWVDFARGYVVAAHTLNVGELRDDAEGILIAIAQDLASPQSREQQAARSKGSSDPSYRSLTAAISHGAARSHKGFTAQDVVAEYRALRASVLRLWAEAEVRVESTTLEDVNRFNEAIDQALAESIGRYLHDLDASKDLFLGILGHDLRNPLGAIMMSATAMIEDGGGQSSPQARRSEIILRSALRMEQIIRDLLDFTRSHLGSGIPIERVGMDLEKLCRQTVDEISAFHPDRELRVQATGELQGRWDKERIAQVVSNLLGNAIQHGSPDSPITVSVSGGPTEVAITVHNWGAPIPSARLRDIFDPMKRFDPNARTARNLTSLGLGLYIAKEVAASHGGTIDVESSAERGTTFTVRLPRLPQDQRADSHVH